LTSAFRVWAKKSDKGSKYIHCHWCKSDILPSNLNGKHGHEKSRKHIEKQKEYDEKVGKEELNPIVHAHEEILSSKLFTFRLTKLCLGMK